MMSLPVWVPGPMFLRGGVVSVQRGLRLCPGCVSVHRGSLSRGSLSGGLCRETPRNQKSGRYASYGNAFLLLASLRKLEQ